MVGPCGTRPWHYLTARRPQGYVYGSSLREKGLRVTPSVHVDWNKGKIVEAHETSVLGSIRSGVPVVTQRRKMISNFKVGSRKSEVLALASSNQYDVSIDFYATE